MLNRLNALGRSAWYWLAMIALGLSLEAVALYYQYELGYGPCVLCVHVRLWVAAFVLVAVLGLIGHRSKPLRLTALLLGFGTLLGMLERSWRTLGVERGWLEGSCSMESGLPAWFAPDQWWPWMFEIWEPCGYTPEMPFGITMAEALVALSGALVLVWGLMLIAGLRRE